MNTLIFLAVIILDQLSKFYAIKYLKPSFNFNLINNVLTFTYVENYGAAFGMFKNCRALFIVLTVVIVFFSFYIMRKNKSKSKVLNMAIIFFVSGGVGNLIDRIIHGYVIDFISLSFFAPVFNVADIFITIGAITFILYVFYNKGKECVK